MVSKMCTGIFFYYLLGDWLRDFAHASADIRKVAEKVSEGRLGVILCGGSRKDLASLIFHRVIEVLVD